jgi:hypothetical protein
MYLCSWKACELCSEIKNMKYKIFFSILLTVVFSRCGYHFRGSDNPWKDEGIEKVYIRNVDNNTLTVGLDAMVRSATTRELSRGKRFIVVNSKDAADGFIDAVITDASSAINTATTVAAIAPKNPTAANLGDFVIASDYRANLAVVYTLVRKRDQKLLFSQSFSDNRLYQGGNNYGLKGSTSSLMNQSQERISLEELTTRLASDMQDTMLEAF